MSEILGIEKQATYSRIENGLLDGTVPQVLVLSALTGISVHRLWNDAITILDIPTQPIGRKTLNNSDPPEQPPEILKLARQVAEILKVEFRLGSMIFCVQDRIFQKFDIFASIKKIVYGN
jgi:hypothetical protein